MNRLSIRNLVIGVVVAASLLLAGVAGFRTTVVVDAAPPHSTLVPF